MCTRDCPNKLNVSRSSPKAAQSWGTVCLDVKVVQKYAAVDGINTCMFLLRVERKIYIYILDFSLHSGCVFVHFL